MERLKAHWQQHKSIWLTIFLVFLVSRILLVSVSFIAYDQLNIPRGFRPWRAELAQEYPTLVKWTVWDSEWYLRIAKDGYADSLLFNPYKQTSIGFFPLYPFIFGIFGNIIGDNVVSGFIVSNIFLIASAFLLYKLVRLDYDEALAHRSVWYLFLFPTAYILSTIYPESLFLFLSLLSFYLARRNHWLLAGCAGYLLALTKPVGFLISFPLLYLYLKQKDFSLKNIRWNIFSLGLIPCGLLSFGLYSWILTGDFFAYSHIKQYAWGHVFSNPFALIIKNITSSNSSDIITTLALVIAIVIVLFGIKKINIEYLLYSGILLFFILVNGETIGTLRYVSVIFPLFIIFAKYAHHEKVDRILMMSLALLQGFLFVFWVGHFWFVS